MARSRNRSIVDLIKRDGQIKTSALRLKNDDALDSAEATAIVDTKKLTYLQTLDSLPISVLTSGQRAFVESNQRMYISNGAGWYNTGFVNLSPAFDSDLDSAFTIADSATALVLTNPASDSDNPDAIISYGGSFSDSGQYMVSLTRDSSVWTFNPLSFDSVYENVTAGNIPDSNGGTFSYTFTASDQINLASKTISITYDTTPPITSYLVANSLIAYNVQRGQNAYGSIEGSGYLATDRVTYSITGTGASDADYTTPSAIAGSNSNTFNTTYNQFYLQVQPAHTTNNAGDYETHTLNVDTQSENFKIYPYGHRIEWDANNFINWNIYQNSDLASSNTWSIRAWSNTDRERIYEMFARCGNQGTQGNRRSFQGLKIYCIISGNGVNTTGTKSVQGTTVQETAVVWAGTPDLTYTNGTSGNNRSIAFSDWNSNNVTRSQTSSAGATYLCDRQGNLDIQLWKIEAYSNAGLTTLINTVYATAASPYYAVV